MLKIIYPLIILVVNIGLASSQTNNANVELLTQKIGTAKGKNKTFEQKFEQSDQIPTVFKITINDVEHGNEICMMANAIDINPSQIIFEPKKDIIEIKAQITGGRKLIKILENGNSKDYINKIIFYSSEIEEARTLKNALEEFVKTSQEKNKQQQEKDYSKQDLLELIRSNTTEVTINDDRYNQKIDENNSNIIHLQREDLSKGTKEQFQFNLADLYQSQIDFETRRNQVFVSLNTKAGNKLIGYTKNGETGNYTNNTEVLMPSIEIAREYSDNLKQLIEIGENEETTDYSGYGYAECIIFLQKNIGKVDINKDTYVQSFETNTDNSYIFSITSQDVSKGVIYTYKVNAADLKKGKTRFDSKSNAVIIELETQDKSKLIGVSKNGDMDNYISSFIVQAPGIESARALSEVFSRFKELARETINDTNAFSNDNEARTFIKGAVYELVINTDTYEQSIEISDENNCSYVYEITDVSKNVNYRYEVNLQDVDVHKVIMDTNGPSVYVGIETKGKKKLIKSYKNGEVDKFIYQFTILMPDIEQARKFVPALKTMIARCE